uniref:Protein TIC 214 n=1 Tax=Didymoplexis pallens TaxID=2848458 RepID=A0A976UFI6_9ASPA|nr:Ycf1 protein [Didymoplexis pallens]UVG41019.1 Ycf1 protein [Didymoplexis pallens]
MNNKEVSWSYRKYSNKSIYKSNYNSRTNIFKIVKKNHKICPSFTYPSGLSSFLKMLEQRISLYIIKNDFDQYSYNWWIYTNEINKFHLNNEFRSRIQVLDQEEVFDSRFGFLERSIILGDNEKGNKCLARISDPFLNGPYRGILKKSYSNNRKITSDCRDLVKVFLINKISYIFLNSFRNSLFEVNSKSILNQTIDKEIRPSKSQANYLKFLFYLITTHTNKRMKNHSFRFRIKEVSKRVPKWPYKLIEDLNLDEEDELEEEDLDIYSRRYKRMVIDHDSNDHDQTEIDHDSNDHDQTEEVALIHYYQNSDFRRNLIKGSIRSQRRKTIIWYLFQVDVHSPLFLYRLYKASPFSFKNQFLKYWGGMKEDVDEKEYQRERVEIAESWDTIILTQVIRGLMLVTQSFFRKYILLPTLIITKNVFLLLLFKNPEWDEDFQEWKKEMHIKCTYEGVQLSDKEFPQSWLINGLQIKILDPFCLKFRRISKAQPYKKYKKKNPSFFLTVWGKEADSPFGSPRKRSYIFEYIPKELKVLKKRVKVSLLLFLKEKLLKKKEQKNDTQKIEKNRIFKSSIIIRTTDWLNDSLMERRIQYFSDNIIEIGNQIERISRNTEKITKVQDHNILTSTIRKLGLKSNFFRKYFIGKIYRTSLLNIIAITKMDTQRLLNFKIDRLTNVLCNTKRNKEIEVLNGMQQDQIPFDSTRKKIKESFTNTEGIKKDPNNRCNLYSLSQASVLYKLTKIPLLKNSQIRDMLQYKGNSPFFQEKMEYIRKEWKSWLKGHYQYYLSKNTKGFLLVLKECRNKINQYYTLKKKEPMVVLKEYTLLFKRNDYEVINQKNKWNKYYRYDLLSYKYINWESTLVRKGYESKIFSYQYEPEFFDILLNAHNKEKIYPIRKNFFTDRIYLDSKIIPILLINQNRYIGKKTIQDIELGKREKENVFLMAIRQIIDPDKKIDSEKIDLDLIYFKQEEHGKQGQGNRLLFPSAIQTNYMRKDRSEINREVELDQPFEQYLIFQLRWTNILSQKMMNNLKVYCLILRLINPKKVVISSIQRGEIDLKEILNQKYLVLSELIRKGILIFEPISLSLLRNERSLIYQTLDISLKKNRKKHRIDQKYKDNMDKKPGKGFEKLIPKYKDKNNYNYVPENILSYRRRRELRIRNCFNMLIKVPNHFINEYKHIYSNNDIKSFFELNNFMWPNFRLEDIACINRYWFDTDKSSCFSKSRIHMYPKLHTLFHLNNLVEILDTYAFTIVKHLFY